MISLTDSIHALLVLAGAAFSLMVCGGALTFGVASVSRWMKWAPVNTTININNYREVDEHAITPAHRQTGDQRS